MIRVTCAKAYTQQSYRDRTEYTFLFTLLFNTELVIKIGYFANLNY